MSKQVEAQVALKKKLLPKLEAAKELYETEKNNRAEAKAQAKIEAYNNWRLEEEKKGKFQDAHAKSLVKKMMDAVATKDLDLFYPAMALVLGNLDGKLLFLNKKINVPSHKKILQSRESLALFVARKRNLATKNARNRCFAVKGPVGGGTQSVIAKKCSNANAF